MKPSKKTIAKLTKLKAFIRKEPRRFDMSWWGTTVQDPKKLRREPNIELIDQHGEPDWDLSVDRFIRQNPPCGTMACLAGSALIMAGKIKPKFTKRAGLGEHVAVFGFGDDTPDKAAKYLGINDNDAYRLFHVDGWPDEFSLDFWEHSPKRQVERACKRIDHFIETGE